MKSKLAVRGTADSPLIGLFQEGSHNVVPMSDCPANHPAINKAIKLLRESMLCLGVEPYNENKQTGVLRYVQFFVCREDGLVQLVLVTRDRKAAETLAQNLRERAKWHSIWLNIHTQPTNQIFGKEWHLYFGEEWIWQQMGRCKAAFHPAAFSQANLLLFDRVLEKLDDWVEPNASLLELYAGTGAISFHLEPYWQSACLVENNPFAQISFDRTAASGVRKPMQYIRADAALGIKFFDEADCIIADPPRKGLDAELLAALRAARSKTFIYISCSFQSFWRDAKQLLESGWSLDDAALYWMFPNTPHIEIAAKWKKM